MTSSEILDALDEFYNILPDHGLQSALPILNNLYDAVKACDEEQDDDEEEDTAVVWAEAQAVELLKVQMTALQTRFNERVEQMADGISAQLNDRIGYLINKTADLGRRATELEAAVNNLAKHAGKEVSKTIELEKAKAVMDEHLVSEVRRVTALEAELLHVKVMHGQMANLLHSQEKVNQITDQQIKELQRHAWMARPDLARQLKIEEFIPF